MDLEVFLREGVAQLVQDEVEAGSRLEGDERRPIKEPRAREPFRGLGRERGLALSAESVQHDDVPRSEGTLEVEQFAGASMKSMQWRGRESAAHRLFGNCISLSN